MKSTGWPGAADSVMTEIISVPSSSCYFPNKKRLRLNILLERFYGLPTMTDFDPDLDDVKLSNVIGLLMIMREIQNQKPLDDPRALGIDEKGKPYYLENYGMKHVIQQEEMKLSSRGATPAKQDTARFSRIQIIEKILREIGQPMRSIDIRKELEL